MTRRAASQILSALGVMANSRGWLKGVGILDRATRMIGARRDLKPCSATMADIPEAMPQFRLVSSAATSRPARPLDVGAAEGDRVILLRHVTLDVHQPGMVDEHSRIVALDRAAYQPFDVIGAGRHHDFETGGIPQHRLRTVAVLGGATASQSMQNVVDDRYAKRAVGHVAGGGPPRGPPRPAPPR